MGNIVSLAVLVFALCASRGAGANDGVGVIVTGEPSLRHELTAHVEAWLRDRGHALVPAPLPPDAVGSLVDCFAIGDEACAQRIFETKARSTTLAFTRVDLAATTDGGRNLTMTGYWFRRGHDVIAERRFCERCSPDGLRASVAELMTALTAADGGSAGRLRLTSSPPGAQVRVNNTAIGVTPLTYDLPPGNHTVALVLDRYDIETRRLTIKAGETSEVDVPLVRSGEATIRSRAPLFLAGAGIAAAGAGIALLAIDEDVSPAAPLRIRDTAPAGVASLAVGVVAVAVGLGWWLGGSDASGPVASMSSGSAYVGWTAPF